MKNKNITNLLYRLLGRGRTRQFAAGRDLRVSEAGRLAREALENPVFMEVFLEMERELVGMWKDAPSADTEGREKLWSLVQSLNVMKQKLQRRINEALIEEKYLKQEKIKGG